MRACSQAISCSLVEAVGGKETIAERGQNERLVEKGLSWYISNSKMILF